MQGTRKFFYYLLIIILLLNCFPLMSNNSDQVNKKETKWEKEQSRKILKIALSDLNNFYSLGIGNGNNYEEAENIAVLDADEKLANLIESSVESMNVLIQEEVKRNGKSIVNENSDGIIISSSQINLKDPQHRISDKKEFDNKFYVAVIASQNRQDYNNNIFLRYAKKINGEKVQTFIDKANERYKEILENSAEKKVKSK
jgi:hypothetical protein